MLEVKSFNSFNGRPISCTSFWHDTCLADVVDDACEDSSQQEKTAESPNLYIYTYTLDTYIVSKAMVNLKSPQIYHTLVVSTINIWIIPTLPE